MEKLNSPWSPCPQKVENREDGSPPPSSRWRQSSHGRLQPHRQCVDASQEPRGAPLSRESFRDMKNHFPKILAAVSPSEGLKALQKVDRRSVCYWGERKAVKAEPEPGEGELSAAWDAAPLGCRSALSARSEDGEPRGLSKTPLCKEGLVPLDPSPCPLLQTMKLMIS